MSDTIKTAAEAAAASMVNRPKVAVSGGERVEHFSPKEVAEGLKILADVEAAASPTIRAGCMRVTR